jgi:hypothetical protein
MKKFILSCLCILLFTGIVTPYKSFAGWPIGKYHDLFVPAFNYFKATDSWDANGKKIKGAPGTGFESYALNLFEGYGISRRLDFIASLPVVYQTSKYVGGSNRGYGPTDLNLGLSYNLVNSNYERFLSIQASAIVPLYNKNNLNTAVGYGSLGSELKFSYSGNIPKRILKGCYFNTEIYYRRYFAGDGPNQYGAFAFLGFMLSKSNQITVDVTAIKSVSANRDFNPNISSIKDFSLIKPSLNFGHRFTRRFSMFVGGYYTVAGRNTAIGYGTNVSGIFHL